ncbi:MAG: hypothetical protein Kow00122_00680 [Thermoleophilia bacterium]
MRNTALLKRPIVLIVLLAAGTAVLLAASVALADKTQSDEAIVLAQALEAAGTPVLDVALLPASDGRVVRVRLQSAGTGDQSAPTDPVHINNVLKEARRLRTRGSPVETVRIELVDSRGITVLTSEEPLDTGSVSLMPDNPLDGGSLDPDGAVSVLRARVADEMDLRDATLESASVSSDTRGARVFQAALSIGESVDGATAASRFLTLMPRMIHQLNTERGGMIAELRVDVHNAAGETLISFVQNMDSGEIHAYIAPQAEAIWRGANPIL